MKGQGYGGWGCNRVSDLFQIFLLFDSSEGEEDFSEGRMEDTGRELLQVVVEGVGDKEVQHWSG